MSKVSKRGGFSDRNKIKPINTDIQLKNLDERTRVQLQNLFSQLFQVIYENNLYGHQNDVCEFFRYVLNDIYSEPVGIQIDYRSTGVINLINKTVREDEYDDVLTLIEGITQYWDNYLTRKYSYSPFCPYSIKFENKRIYNVINDLLKREFVGYRFVDKILVPITDTYELETLREAMVTIYEPVYQHLSKANKLLADREKPDYENSIKESISAIEAICEIITGITGKDATLGKMLKKLEDEGINIHPSLKAAFNVLYGYTSDANGIRHAGNIGGELSTFEEAKFMLVTCSAFINYLTALSA